VVCVSLVVSVRVVNWVIVVGTGVAVVMAVVAVVVVVVVPDVQSLLGLPKTYKVVDVATIMFPHDGMALAWS
jgi:hypothetical protein